ncbi:hypothetical protein ACWFQ8_18380 [Streptomyces sp. NPDC055254]
MTPTEATPPTPDPTTPTPDPARPPTRQEPAPPTDTPRNRHHDSVVLIALLATCAGIYLIVGENGFAGVITAVAGLYGTLRMRR